MIHPSAVMDDTAEIGIATIVWQFATVIRRASIGDRCSIGACSIVDGAIVGDDCAIGHGAQLHPGTKIGNRVFVGPGAIFTNDVWPQVGKAGYGMVDGRYTVIVEDDASICAGAIILPGSRIGAGSLVAAGVEFGGTLDAGCYIDRHGAIRAMPEDRGVSRRMRFA